MTRFLLPLPAGIELVMYAFRHARQGDILVKKAPACTVADLVAALLQLFRARVPVRRIGIRHGEKIYETLVSREELLRAEDLGGYYRIAMDTRDLNFAKYFTEGDRGEIETEDYTSHNTKRLDVAAVKKLLLTLPEVRAALQEAGRAAR